MQPAAAHGKLESTLTVSGGGQTETHTFHPKSPGEQHDLFAAFLDLLKTWSQDEATSGPGTDKMTIVASAVNGSGHKRTLTAELDGVKAAPTQPALKAGMARFSSIKAP